MTNFTDTFTGSNGTALTAHTSDSGHTWVVPPSGTSMILGGNRAYSQNTYTVRNQTTATPASADYTVEADLYFASLVTGIEGGVTARDTGEGTKNLYALRYVRSTDIFRLSAIVAGSESVLGTLAASAVAGTTRHLKLTVAGTTISGWVDDVLVASVTHSGLSAAGHGGTYAYGAVSSLTTGLHLDNYTQTDPGVTASPTGIASTLAFGAVAVALSLAVAPTGIASAEAFGTPVVTIPITASPSGIGSGEAFGSPTVSTSLAAAPTGIVSSEAFGTVTVSMSGNVSPVGIPSGEAFGTPTVTATLVASPTGIGSAEAFGTPTVAATLTASPTSIPSAEAFGVPVVSLALTVGPTGIVSGEAFGTLSVLGVPAPTPATRTVTVAAESRTIGVPAETRTVTVPAELRVLVEAAESRTVTIPAESRTVRMT